MKILFLIIFSLFLIPLASVATAEQVEKNVMAFIQIFQRDAEGTLIGYLEYEQAQIIDLRAFEAMLYFHESDSKIVEKDGKSYRLTTFETSVSTDASGLMSTVNLGLRDSKGQYYIAVAVAHDGMRVPQPEEVTVIWNFLSHV